MSKGSFYQDTKDRSNIAAMSEKPRRLTRSLTGDFKPRSKSYKQIEQATQTPVLKTRSSFDVMGGANKPVPGLPLFHSKPVLVKNTYANISSRPSNFIKPAAQHQYTSDKASSDLECIAKWFVRYNHKMYNEGFLSMMVAMTPEGKYVEHPQWKPVFAELCGSTLSIWNAEKSNRRDAILPSYINITDAILEIISQETYGKANCFSIANAAGANRFIFVAGSKDQLEKWESCFWLASFEGTKLNEMYTRQILSRPTYRYLFLRPTSNTLEGYLQVRFAGKSDWQRLWAVVERKDEKRIWSKRSQSPMPAYMHLYADRKSKAPFMAVTNVARTYSIYPENPKLSEYATTFKIEGTITPATSKTSNASIPERISYVLFTTKTSKEMAVWLLAIFDIFKLYGRPRQLYEDPLEPKSMNYGEDYLNQPGKLFLDIAEVQGSQLCGKKRWDQKGVFADALRSKLETQCQEVPSSPIYVRVRTQSLPPVSVSSISPTSSKLVPIKAPLKDEPSGSNFKVAKQESIVITTPSIADSSDEDTEDEVAAESDDDESDDSCTFNGKEKTKKIDKPKKERKSDDNMPEIKHLSRQNSSSSSFLLDFGNLSGSKNTLNSDASGASSSSLFGEFAYSDEFSKYIDPDVLKEEKYEITDEDSNEVKYPVTDIKEEQSPLPKSRSRGIFPAWSWNALGGSYDEDDYQAQQGEGLTQRRTLADYGGREVPQIPALGDNFASETSLLGQKPKDQQMNVQEQIAYARATRQPFMHVPVKPKAPKSGLVGRITQLESERQNSFKRGEEKMNSYMTDSEKDYFFERERRIMEQRQQQYFQQMMMNGNIAMMPVIQTPHGLVPMIMPYPMSPQGSLSTPTGATGTNWDAKNPRLGVPQSSSNTSSPACRSPFVFSSSSSSSYTSSSIHSQFSNPKLNLSFNTATNPTADGSSGDEDDHIPIAKTPTGRKKTWRTVASPE
ncbi:hypothetical protein INT43_001139 [Umbelopsis isabellina]|uniref:PH domain-containing protein n=1 Tax=Mortierella isabellina TaxID=91625 RepID=A0A8H7UBI1_MORIS|nr:hypothetical protein INT43_001139 [Umbelopsis isabellina]